MGRLDTSKAGELRMLAEKFRRRAKDMSLMSYVTMMRQAAEDLDAEARSLERQEPIEPGRHLDIRI
jgi:hypothetical protein